MSFFYTKTAYLVGNFIWAITRIPLHLTIRTTVLRQVAKFLKINLNEAEKPLLAYPTINALFTRGLQSGLRPVGDAWLVSPVDGTLISEAQIHEGKTLQAKTIRYPLEKLIPTPEAKAFRFGHSITIYLAPSDCHRIFSPVSGTIVKTIHVPGALFPVREPYISGLPGLYTTNERMITLIQTPVGQVAVVMVAAINVSKIGTEYETLAISRKKISAYTHHHSVTKGAWLATFHMGSTVIVLTEKPLQPAYGNTGVVRYGESLAYI